MSFSYSALRAAEKSGDRVGHWKGFPVFSCSEGNLHRKSEGAYFIVYDDENAIVRKQDGEWYQWGKVSESGTVNEFDKRKRYGYYESPKPVAEFHPVCGKTADKCDGTAAVAAHDEVVGDVKLGIDVDATLRAAREMTVDSLLEGFNYGLEAKG